MLTGENTDSEVNVQPLTRSSEVQNNLFGSGFEQVLCMTPLFRPQTNSKSSPSTNSFSLVMKSERQRNKGL